MLKYQPIMRMFESKSNSGYTAGSNAYATEHDNKRRQEQINSVNLQKARTENNNIVTENIITKLKNNLLQEDSPSIKLTIFEKNPIRGQEDLEVILTPIEVTTQNVIYTKSDCPETEKKSLNHYGFCLQTKLAIRGQQEFLQENTNLTSQFNNQC